jgi:glycosyltransferase involved in cell wall biosynthesis
MYRNKKISVVVPAYNEETQIAIVIDTMPDLVDHIVIVNDLSKDRTAEVVTSHPAYGDSRIVLINHEENQGVGGAIATGYKWSRDNGIDISVVMAGDAQMNPADLPAILDPVVDDRVDYTKGNRLVTGEAFKRIPKIRFFGNSALSLFTKIASGYWHVADSQTGYTAINARALKVINWDKMFKRYGQPNDLLVKLNVEGFRVQDVPVEPVYNVGEQSGINIRKVIFTIGSLLVQAVLLAAAGKIHYPQLPPAGLLLQFRFFDRCPERAVFPAVHHPLDRSGRSAGNHLPELAVHLLNQLQCDFLCDVV